MTNEELMWIILIYWVILLIWLAFFARSLYDDLKEIKEKLRKIEKEGES